MVIVMNSNEIFENYKEYRKALNKLRIILVVELDTINKKIKKIDNNGSKQKRIRINRKID